MPEVIDLIKRKAPPAFCRTPAAADILPVLDLARELDCIGAIVGAPGVGKTSTLVWYAQKNKPGVRYCAMNPAQASMTAMLSRLCAALGVAAPYRRSELHRAVCGWTREGESRALLIDEAQHLNQRSLDELRCIHDESGVAMVFAGNDRLRERINTRAAAFAQFTSRIGPRVEMGEPTVADARALARHYGIEQPGAVAFLEKRIGTPAGLRQLAHLLTLGRKLAGAGVVRLSHLKQAAAVLEAVQ